MGVAATALLGCATLGTVSPAVAAETRAVLELFTSQGCDSCPPADKLLGELSQGSGDHRADRWRSIIGIISAGKTRLALAGHGNRQRAYARVRGDRDVFTPQVIVNGSAQALGSDKAQIERAIVQSRRLPTTLSMPLSLTVNDDKLSVNAPDGKSGAERAEVWLCPITKAVPVEITRGENKGTLDHLSQRRSPLDQDSVNGTAPPRLGPCRSAISRPKPSIRLQSIVQSGTAAAPGAMLAAAMMPLR